MDAEFSFCESFFVGYLRSRSHRARVFTVLLKRLAVIAGCAGLLSACGGGNEIDPPATGNYIAGVVLHQTGFRPLDIRCPSGIPARPGGRFNCHFTGPEGPYTAYLRIVKVHGRRVVYRLDTQPSSWTPPTLR